MATKKETRLSIVLRAIDHATAPIQALNARLDATTKPIRNLKNALGGLREKSGLENALGGLREKSGLDDVIGGFKGVGSAIAGVLSKVALLGGVVGGAVAALVSIIDEFDELGDKAEAIGVSVDFLAQMRYAAEQAGASVEQLDGGMQALSKSLGQARAGTGRMLGFVSRVSPELAKQLRAAKSNTEALDLLAGAMAKITDPAKKAALASAAFGDAALAPLLAKGPAELQKLREEYAKLNPNAGEAAEAAGKFDGAMKKLKASTQGVKAALVTGLAPGLQVIIERLTEWLVEHQEDIKVWAIEVGQKLPGAVQTLVGKISGAISTIRGFFDEGWKVKALLVGLAAVIVGPVIGAIASLGVALLTNPIGLIVAGIAGAAALIIKYWGPISEFFSDLWDGVVGAFDAAWARIKAIVDAVVNAVDEVISAAGRIGGVGAIRDLIKENNPTAAAPTIDLSEQMAGPQSFRNETKILVEFANAPRGVRVKADPKSSADVDMSVGYQLLVG